MARLSNKITHWQPAKGKVKGKVDTYWAIQANRDTLFDIHNTYKKTWGYEWYELVRCGMYDTAKMVLANRGKGECLRIAIQCIDDIAYLEKQMEVQK